jgi:3-hydroxybutyryl-CoA dehydrogenase
MNVTTVGVIGAGTMGNGIAHVFAQSGFQVVLVDVEQKFLDKAKATIEKNLGRMVEKQKITQEVKDATLGASRPVWPWGPAGAVCGGGHRGRATKKTPSKLDAMCRPTPHWRQRLHLHYRAAVVTKRTDKFIGMHFMNPCP